MALLRALLGVFVTTALVHASCTGSQFAQQNIKEKLYTDSPSAGADYAMGAKAAAMYVYIETAKTQPAVDNAFGCKVAIHEYQHILQQGFLSRQITSLTPPTDTLGVNRFKILNPAGRSVLPHSFETKVKGCLDSLPAKQKLLTVPTYVILVPFPESHKLAESLAVSKAEEYMDLFYQKSQGCPGANFMYNFMVNENNAMAEGEAEYYSESSEGYMKDAMTGWTSPVFNHTADWINRIAENTRMLTGTPGKAKFFVRSGNTADMNRLDADGWQANPTGELTYNYLKTVWRTNTTQEDLQNIWIKTAVQGYGAAFQEVMGQKWSKFVCDMQLHYGTSVGTCTQDDAWNARWRSPLQGSASIHMITGAILTTFVALLTM